MTPDIDELLGRMSRRDKLDQLQIVWKQDLGEAAALARRGIGALFWPGNAADTNELQRVAREESPHGIPLLIGLDVVHGQRTTFPIPLAQAASLRPAVARTDAEVSAAEARARGRHWTFSPMIDVSRDPRWGRVAEGFGEDPLVERPLRRREGARLPGRRPHGADLDRGDREALRRRTARRGRPRLQHRRHVRAAAAERVPHRRSRRPSRRARRSSWPPSTPSPGCRCTRTAACSATS